MKNTTGTYCILKCSSPFLLLGELSTIVRRCQGKVFAAEKMVAASGFYHRHCFRCCFCAQPLDSTSVCDGPDNKVRRHFWLGVIVCFKAHFWLLHVKSQVALVSEYKKQHSYVYLVYITTQRKGFAKKV